jgi:hypothetical protein
MAMAEAASVPPPAPRYELHTAPPHRGLRPLGIGLLAASGLCLALGFTFVGLAKSANDDALKNGMYDPTSEDRRTDYQVTDGAFFIAAGVTFFGGIYLVWDR